MLRSATTPPRLSTLVLVTALSVLSLNMFLPSLATMAAAFGVDYALMSVAVGGYLAVTAVVMLVLGPLSDRVGRRPVLLGSLAVFTLASLVCATTGSFGVFLAFRLAQGVVIAGSTLSLAVIRDTAPPQEAASRIGYLSMAMAIAPMLGPLLGGALDGLLGWRASFVAYTLFGAAAFVLCWTDLGETAGRRPAGVAERRRAWPALLRSRRFWGYALCMAFSTGSFYAFLAGAPLAAVAVLGLDPATLGLVMGSVTAGFAAGSFLSGRFAARRALTTMMIAGRAVGGTALLAALALALAGAAHPLALLGAIVLVGVGNGLTTPSSNAGALSVRPDLAGSASGLAGALTVGGGAAVTAATGAIVSAEHAVVALIAVMLACAVAGLAAALDVRAAERRVAAAPAPSPA